MPRHAKPSTGRTIARTGNPANLRPWRKGQSGNPQGRPSYPHLREALAEVLAEPVEGVASLYAILRSLRDRAVQGDVRAAEVLLDRGFGKPMQRTDLTSNGENLIPVRPPIAWTDERP